MTTDLKLSEELFKEKILRLESSFRIAPLSKETLTIYYEKLKGFRAYDFSRAIEQIIEKECFFPSIAKILEFKPDAGQEILTDEKLRELNE